MSESQQFLQAKVEVLRAQIARAQAVAREGGEAVFRKPGPFNWNVGQIFAHLTMSIQSYVDGIEGVIDDAPTGESPLKMTFVGSKIAKFAGPENDVPAPKEFSPTSSDLGMETLHQFVDVTNRLIDLTKKMDEVDLAATKFKNPLMPIVKMNLVDAYTIACEHNERHIRQIEASK